MRRLTSLLTAGLIACTLPAFADVREVEVGVNGNEIFRDTYSSDRLTVINVGDTVQWVWRRDLHTTHSEDGLWYSLISAGHRTFEYTFNEAGTYRYYCDFHVGNGMRGEVQVRLPGDADLSGCVDDADLAAAIFAFGQQGTMPEDLNYDRVVDDADLALVIFNFGIGC